MDGLKKSLGENICSACFSGEYPTPVFNLINNLKRGENCE
jgi:glutamine phosphoribosylpyrophosphate amidotransferase